MNLQPGDLVADMVSKPPVADLVRAGIKAVGLYLKYYDPAYWGAVEAAGIAIVPIFEVNETRALGGAAIGMLDGKIGAAKALSFGLSAGKSIIFTHDSSSYGGVIPDYFQAAALEVVKAGFSFISGYWSKFVAEEIAGLGVPVLLNWAPAAWAWGGGRDPFAQIWQAPSGPLPTNQAYRVDMGVCKIAVELHLTNEHLAPVIPPTPTLQRKRIPMIKNVEAIAQPDVDTLVQIGLLPAGQAPFDIGQGFWQIMDDGRLRHITNYAEVVGRGGDAAAEPITTVLLKTFTAWKPEVEAALTPVVQAPPFVLPNLTVTSTIVAS